MLLRPKKRGEPGLILTPGRATMPPHFTRAHYILPIDKVSTTAELALFTLQTSNGGPGRGGWRGNQPREHV